MILPLMLFLLCFPQTSQTSTQVDPQWPMAVSNSKWTKERRKVETINVNGSGPAAAMIPQNKIYDRTARINDPAGSRDPNQDTIDGRSAAIEKSVQESRSAGPKTLDGFLYKVKVQNLTNKVVEAVFWEYQFADLKDPNLRSRHQFLCGATIAPDKGITLQGFGLSGPVEVVSVDTLAQKSVNAFQEKVVINRIEYTDGMVWQRKGWHLDEVKSNYERVLREPWTLGMCKAL